MSGSRDHWGPYGWKTLHSVAILYPDEPSKQDKELMRTWLTNFTATITCPFCKEHFEQVVAAYGKTSDIFANRHNFYWFTIKAHNTANAKLNKSQIVRYADAYAMFKARDETPVRQYYYTYIGQVAVMEQGVDGFLQARKASSMQQADGSVFQAWFRATDWADNSITRVLAANPEVKVDVQLQAPQARTSVLPTFSGGGWSIGLMNHAIARR